MWHPSYLRQYIGERKSQGNYIDVWSESAGARGYQDEKNQLYNIPRAIGSIPVDLNGNNMYDAFVDAEGVSGNFQNGIEYSYWTAHNTISFQGWVKSHQPYNQWNTSNGGVQYSNAINRGMFDQCRQDQIPFVAPQFTPNVTNKSYYSPGTLTITDLQNNTGRKAYFGVPSADANTTEGYTTTSPNRDAENQYIKLKEHCKELMFLPKDLKKDFIDYFVNWAKKEYKGGKDSVRYLNTIDPLNWSRSSGIGSATVSMYRLLETKAAIENFGAIPWAASPKIVRGFSGFVDPKYTHELLHNNGGLGGWFYGVAKHSNPWWQTYSTDSGAGRLSPYVAPSSSSSSGYVGYSCFVAGSKILLSNGKYKNIEEVKTNDIALSYNLLENKFEESSIGDVSLDYKNELIKVYLKNGKTITSTDTHPYYVKDKGWSVYVGAGDFGEEIGPRKQLSVDDKLYYYDLDTKNFIFIKIEKIIKLKPKTTRVWNLRNVTNNHNFVVNNLLVHNKNA